MTRYDEIVVSHDELCRIMNSCIDSIRDLKTHLDREIRRGYSESIATKIAESCSFFFDSIRQCLNAMSDDWRFISFCTRFFLVLDASFADQLLDAASHVEAGPSSEEFGPRVPDSFVGPVPYGFVRSPNTGFCGPMPMGVQRPITHVDLDYEYLHVSDREIESVRSVADALRRAIDLIDVFIDAATEFVGTDAFQGMYAQAVKAHIENTHIRIMRTVSYIAYSMYQTSYEYAEGYASCIGNGRFEVDERELEELILSLRSRADRISGDVVEVNAALSQLALPDDVSVHFRPLNDQCSGATDRLAVSIRRELTALKEIEDGSRPEVSGELEDIDQIDAYGDLMRVNAGQNMLCSDTVTLDRINNAVDAGLPDDAVFFTEHFLINDDGSVNENRRSMLRDVLLNDPSFSERLNRNDITVGSLSATLRYMRCLMAEDVEKSEAVKSALERLCECPGWLTSLNAAGNGYNDYLANDSNFRISVENMPEAVIDGALKLGVNMANDDSHGYNNSVLRWGDNGDYDCASFAVYMFAEGGGLDINYGLDKSQHRNIAVFDMASQMADYGFVKVPFDGDCTKLQRGDIIVINPDCTPVNGHAGHDHIEVYMGDGVVIHATNISFTDDVQTQGDDMAQRFRNHPYYADPDSDEDTSGKTYLDNYCEDFNATFGTNITSDNYKVNGIPFVGEISGYRIASVEDPETYIDYGDRGPVPYIVRYTGGIPVSCD